MITVAFFAFYIWDLKKKKTYIFTMLKIYLLLFKLGDECFREKIPTSKALVQ